LYFILYEQNGRAELNCDGQRLPPDASYGVSNFRSSDLFAPEAQARRLSGGSALFAPEAQARRLSGGSARPFAPPSLYYLIVSHPTVRLNACALGLIYRRREWRKSPAAKSIARNERRLLLSE